MNYFRTLAFFALVAFLLAISFFGGRWGADVWQKRSTRYTGNVTALTPPTGFSQLTLPPPGNVPCEFAVGDRVDLLIQQDGDQVPLLLDCLLTSGPKPVTIIAPLDRRSVFVVTSMLTKGAYSMRKTISSEPWSG